MLMMAAMVVSASRLDAASRVELDLSAQQAGTTQTLVRPASDVVNFVVTNRLPRGNYDITVEQLVRVLPALTTPTIAKPAAKSACDEALDAATAIKGAKEETEVGKQTSIVRSKMASCDETQIMDLQGVLASTQGDIPGEYTVGGGLKVTISRKAGETDKKVWTFVLNPPPRGTWITSYGAAIARNRDQKFFSKAGTDGKYIITPEADHDDYKLIPSIYFSWLPADRGEHDWSWSPVAGLGLNTVAVFGGVSLSYNQNLSGILSVGIIKQSRLLGKYQTEQVVSDNLSGDQLTQDVYRPTFAVSIAFRFGENPFKSGTDAAAADGKKK